ncbi:unnamed protein product [Triticum turgidum subsp. durum]|uniref:Uncharacterized protein n=1 Tax=Triticum turgidum subsp. durum TaxID=4567 RepID=A0A9R1AWR4_TRITD|nr:unnamed protein product [Triticum turgidum subsp. durum]
MLYLAFFSSDFVIVGHVLLLITIGAVLFVLLNRVPRGDRLRPGRTADAGDRDPQTRSHRERQEQMSLLGPTFLHYIMMIKQSAPRCTQRLHT